jgi:hypothetical protein
VVEDSTIPQENISLLMVLYFWPGNFISISSCRKPFSVELGSLEGTGVGGIIPFTHNCGQGSESFTLEGNSLL